VLVLYQIGHTLGRSIHNKAPTLYYTNSHFLDCFDLQEFSDRLTYCSCFAYFLATDRLATIPFGPRRLWHNGSIHRQNHRSARNQSDFSRAQKDPKIRPISIDDPKI
jgi:hypothetical protein